MNEQEQLYRPIIAIGVNNIGCDQTGASFQTIVPEGSQPYNPDSDNASCDSTFASSDDVDEELCHFIFPGLEDSEAWLVHRQIKDLVKRFAMKDICLFMNQLAEGRKILLPQTPQNAFDELHRMGMPSPETKGFGYDNFCKYYRK